MLTQQIAEEMKMALKQKDELKLSTLRFLRSALKNKQIDLQYELSDEEVLLVIRTQIKQLNDSMDSFQKAGRTELFEKTLKEKEILERYLPTQLSDDEVTLLVKKAITESGAADASQTGKVIGRVMKEVAGRADGNRVKACVEKLLLVFFVSLSIFGATAVSVHAAFDPFSDSAFTGFMEFVIRLLRVLLLWVGIFAVNIILRGAIQYATASARDAEHEGAWNKMISGFTTTFVIICLFSIATISLKAF